MSLSTTNAAIKNQFISLVLKHLGLSPTTNRQAFFDTWISCENGRATNNPLGTSWDMKVNGQTVFNSHGVKNYPSIETGALATAKTISSAKGYYKNILGGLKNDISLKDFASNQNILKDFDTWGTTGVFFKQVATGIKPTKPVFVTNAKEKSNFGFINLDILSIFRRKK